MKRIFPPCSVCHTTDDGNHDARKHRLWRDALGAEISLREKKAFGVSFDERIMKNPLEGCPECGGKWLPLHIYCYWGQDKKRAGGPTTPPAG